jgi:predicted lipoprotein with Yx(FWY)xxD motif
MTAELFVQQLEELVPEARPVLAVHLDDQEGELLLHLLSLAVTAGGSTPGYSAAGTTSAKSPALANGATATTVHTATATVQGTTERILVDAKGLPLYIYRPDTATKSLVTGQLAVLWPPLVASAPTAHGATGTLTAVATSSGQQVTYNGHFLYTFVQDSPGHVTGQGVQNFFVATPGISANRRAAAPVPPSYGY